MHTTHGLLEADTIAVITGIVNTGLLVVVIIQTVLLRNQISVARRETILANAPYIMPRYVKSGTPILHLKNVGRGSAININIKIKSEKGDVLSTIDRFAFLPEDPTHNTHVDLSQYNKVIIEGTYYDISNKIHKIKQTYTYPPTGDAGIND